MFDRYCRGKTTETGPLPPDTLPHQFDAGRRTSVSAECWAQACGSSANRVSSRLPGPSKRGSLACVMDPPPTENPVIKPFNAAPSPTESPFKNGWGTNEEFSGKSSERAGEKPISKSHQSPSNESERTRKRQLADQALRKMIFFEDLSTDLMNRVLDSLQECSCESHTNVITQGEEGQELFVLENGEVEFFVNDVRQGTAKSGATFGELALLYNAPRAATVRSLTPCRMFTLDRLTLKNIVVAKHSEKRLHSQQVLAQIDVFAHLPASLQLRIADALHPSIYTRGELVIQQGDIGTEFFLIDEGEVEIVLNGAVVATQGSGSYFGELALIYDTPRTASVRVVSEKLKVEVLNSSGFAQLIGADLVAELRKRDPRH